MERSVGCRPGGIRDLLGILRDHGEAIEYHLITLGLRLDWLGSEALSWRDLLVIVRQCPSDSSIARSFEPEQSTWGVSEYLLALVADYLATQTWMQSEDGQKGRNRPKPLPRPGVEDEDTETKKFGADPVALNALDDFLGWAEARVREERAQHPPRDPVTGRFIKHD